MAESSSNSYQPVADDAQPSDLARQRLPAAAAEEDVRPIGQVRLSVLALIVGIVTGLGPWFFAI